MEKCDRFLVAGVGAAIIFLCHRFDLDYGNLAESGLTLSSIVLAVYIAAIVALINSDLSKKMQTTVSGARRDRTQLGVLVIYFKFAALCSLGTIVISSLLILLDNITFTEPSVLCGLSLLSTLGLVFYVENLVFLVLILRFMLNRQIWNA